MSAGVVLQRRPDWPEQLAAFLEEARRRRFRFGQWDCALFAAEAVRRLTGVDLARGLRGRYRNAAGWLQVIQPATTLAAYTTLRLGDPVRATQARRGDVVIAAFAHGQALGVCAGAVAVFPGPRGLVSLPLAQCLNAWRV